MKTNQELKLAKEQYQNLFNSTPLPCWVYDLETLYFLDVNAAAIRDYGYTREEFLSMTIRQIRPEEDIPILEDIIKNKIKPGSFGRDSVRHTKKSGEIISVIAEGNSLIYEERQARIVTTID
ncbi:MAG TPA: PAS domain S-box protein, partial [Pedobacter sp.]